MNRKRHLTVNFLSLALRLWVVMILTMGAVVVFTRGSYDFGHLLFTDFDSNEAYTPYFYNWITHDKQALPRETITDSMLSWTVDKEHVFNKPCFVSDTQFCDQPVGRILLREDVVKLDTLQYLWSDNYYGSLNWSPDGRFILHTENQNMQIMNPDGSDMRNLILPNAPDVYNVIWSPDSQHLAFTSNSNSDVNILATQENHLRTIANSALPVTQLAWSPDGRQLAFVTNVSQTGNASEFYLVNTDGTNSMKASGNTLTYFWGLVWSPDSSRLAVEASDGIYLVNRDGSGLQQITALPPRTAAVWSPDGRYLAFFSGAYGETYLYFMDTDGHNLTMPLIQNHTFDTLDSPAPALFWLK